MQEAFCPEHLKQDVECARVDFSCFTSERDLKAKRYWLGNPLPCTAGVFSGSGGAGKPAPLSFHQWTTLASARMLQALQKPATSTLSP